MPSPTLLRILTTAGTMPGHFPALLKRHCADLMEEKYYESYELVYPIYPHHIHRGENAWQPLKKIRKTKPKKRK